MTKCKIINKGPVIQMQSTRICRHTNTKLSIVITNKECQIFHAFGIQGKYENEINTIYHGLNNRLLCPVDIPLARFC